jgi:hypothetical protein
LKLAQRYEALADPGEHHQPRPAFHARVRLMSAIGGKAERRNIATDGLTERTSRPRAAAHGPRPR